MILCEVLQTVLFIGFDSGDIKDDRCMGRDLRVLAFGQQLQSFDVLLRNMGLREVPIKFIHLLDRVTFFDWKPFAGLADMTRTPFSAELFVWKHVSTDAAVMAHLRMVAYADSADC